MNLFKLLLVLVLLVIVFIYYAIENTNVTVMFASFVGIACTSIVIVWQADKLTGIKD